MENKPKFNGDFQNDLSKNRKNEVFNIMEKTTLSLRKKTNKTKTFLLPSFLTYEINIADLKPKINGHQLYINFVQAKNELESLDILSQMLIIKNNDDLVKFSIGNLKNFLVDIDEIQFIEKHYDTRFNDNLINFLYNLLINKTNDFYILSNISFILNKLAVFIKNENGSYYYDILFENFDNVLKFRIF